MKDSWLFILWLARILCGLGLAFFGLFIFGEGIPKWSEIEDGQLKTMLMLMAFAAFAYFFSWFKPKEGGLAIALAGFLLGLNMFYHGGLGDTEAALIYALPFVIPGVMFWWVGVRVEG